MSPFKDENFEIRKLDELLSAEEGNMPKFLTALKSEDLRYLVKVVKEAYNLFFEDDFGDSARKRIQSQFEYELDDS